MPETQWIDWFPKVGDIRPERYRIKLRGVPDDPWADGISPNRPVGEEDWKNFSYQIPAPVVAPAEDRPPWIDPQCKFRWGDRVKVKNSSRVGPVAYVIHPNDTTEHAGGQEGFTVLIARSLNCTLPYKTSEELEAEDSWFSNLSVDKVPEDALELFTEDLPKHFDDRILDADQPHESVNQQPARVPREIWVSSYGDRLGPWHYPSLELLLEEETSCTPIHFREVLPDDLTNLQYSPGG